MNQRAKEEGKALRTRCSTRCIITLEITHLGGELPARTWVMRPTFGHPPAEGPGTYARERDPGRGSATGSRKVSPPAGPSRLTPSRPGEAKSRSDEAPRCPNRPRLA